MAKDKVYGYGIHCSIHNADTNVSDTTSFTDSDGFTVPCAYCLWIERNQLRNQLKLVTKQRDALLEAVDVAKLVKAIQ